MYVLNLKISNIDLGTVENIIIDEFSPEYRNIFDDLKIFFSESYSFGNSNMYMITITLKQRGENLILSIVIGGAKEHPIEFFTWGTEKRSSHQILKRLRQVFSDFDMIHEIEILDDEQIT